MNPLMLGLSDTPIKEIINYISEYSGYQGRIVWDPTKPDGALHKLLDSTAIKSYAWEIMFPLFESLADTYVYYTENLSKLRR